MRRQSSVKNSTAQLLMCYSYLFITVLSILSSIFAGYIFILCLPDVTNTFVCRHKFVLTHHGLYLGEHCHHDDTRLTIIKLADKRAINEVVITVTCIIVALDIIIIGCNTNSSKIIKSCQKLICAVQLLEYIELGSCCLEIGVINFNLGKVVHTRFMTSGKYQASTVHNNTHARSNYW